MLDEPCPIGDICQRCLAGEISAENAAPEVICLLPAKEIWALTIGSNPPGSRTVSEDELEKAGELLLRIAELLREI